MGCIKVILINYCWELKMEGRKILVLKTTYFDDALEKLRYDNHIDIKEKIANDLIEQFENTFNIDIKEFIEEIEVITPLNLANYTGTPNGSIMGYMRKSYDNYIL